MYVSKQAAEIADTSSALWLDLEGPSVENAGSLNHTFVLVTGTFDAKNRGHIGMFAGTIKGISQLEKVQR